MRLTAIRVSVMTALLACAASLVIVASAGAAAVDFSHHLTGVILAVNGNSLTVRLRTGKYLLVDISEAKRAKKTGVLPLNHAVIMYGVRDANGVFHATSIGHAGPSAQDWSPDT